jgi:hypothetical protein
MKFNKNNYILILLYLIIVIFLLLQIYELYENKIEKFDSNIIRNNNIHSIILDPTEPINNKDEFNGNKYYGTFISSSNNNYNNNALELYDVSDSFSPNQWNKVIQPKIDNNNDIIITDITYDKHKIMICIGLYYDKNNKPIYSIYRKQNININSEWIIQAHDVNIRSLCYDIKTEKLLGISSYNGQIYEQTSWGVFGNIPTPTTTSLRPTTTSLIPTTTSLRPTTTSLRPTTTSLRPTTTSLRPTTTSLRPTTKISDYEYYNEDEYGEEDNNVETFISSISSENNGEDNIIDGWTGPINHDIPMKKIMYSSDEVMIGIGLFDNYIYIKEGVDWKTSYWDKKQINKTKVYDLIYDTNGCFIATSPNGILIQEKIGFMMPFINYLGYNRHNKKKILLKSQILKYKIGYDMLKDDNLKDINHIGADEDLLKYLQKIYELKKVSLDLCSSRKYIRNKNKKINKNDNLNTKYRDIDDLYKKIEDINSTLSK